MKETNAFYKMGYSDGKGRRMDMYLCCFCDKLPDLELKTPCEHIHLVEDSQCPCFAKVENQTERIEKLLTAKYGN